MYLEDRHDAGERVLALHGRWCAAAAPALALAVDGAAVGGAVALDGRALEALDLTGAYFLRRLELRLAAGGAPPTWRGPRPDTLEFAGPLVEPPAAPGPAVAHSAVAPLGTLGRYTVRQGRAIHDTLEFLGRVYLVAGAAIAAPRRFRLPSIVRHVYESGIQAIPIVALVAFLISVIVAYIGAEELRQYGGELYVVDLVTLSVLRELGVLLTAILVAGRSGSAFAAEIGVMRLNDEVDALRAMGLNAIEVLVLPRVIALMIALPLLAVIADAMGLAGGAVLCWLTLDIPFTRYLHRMQEAIAATTFWAGLLKAPVFGFVIAVVGTYRGILVRQSSRELGRMTTVAVVESIFLVLLIDAIFAVAYWELDF